MIDERIVGHWSSLGFSYGFMEASDLGLLADGRGWSAWYNAHGLCVTRFRWDCPRPGLLELRAEWMVEGTSAAGPGIPVFASSNAPEPWRDVTRHSYTFGQAAPRPGSELVHALLFEEPIEFAREFEHVTSELKREDDPTYHLIPYT